MSGKERRTSIPPGLAAQAAQRSVSGVDAIRGAMIRFEDEVRQGFPGRTRPLDLRCLQMDAGLNPRFLYGVKHRQTLKPEVERFIERFNERWLATHQPVPTREERLSEEAEYWKERYLKLARHANAWHHHLRLMRRQLRDHQVETGSVVTMRQPHEE